MKSLREFEIALEGEVILVTILFTVRISFSLPP